MKKNSDAIYLGVDNSEEIEVKFSPKTRKEIRALAKVAGIPEAELLAEYLGDIHLAGLAGVAHRIRGSKKRR